MKIRRMLIKFRNAGTRIGDYIDKKGFYIVLLLCVVVIGATISIVTIRDYKKFGSDLALDDELVQDSVNTKVYEDVTSAASGTEVGKSGLAAQEKEPVEEVSTEQLAERPDKAQEAKSDIQAEKGSQTEKNKKTQEPVQKSDSVSQSQTIEQVKLGYPVYGKVINEYAVGKLIYSKTLQQWTTHTGIDISSEKDTPVKAALDGIVKSIKDDPRYGITITIEHQGGLKTIYSNLSTAKMVKPGQHVKRGTVISGVGSTANFESEDQPHVHFEVLKDGKNVNPMDYLINIS